MIHPSTGIVAATGTLLSLAGISSLTIFLQVRRVTPSSGGFGSGVGIIFKDVPQGTFAVAVLHDENGNGKMDKNFVGIPKEGYGASNNPKKKRRAPTFDEAKFSLNSSEQSIVITLIY